MFKAYKIRGLWLNQGLVVSILILLTFIIRLSVFYSTTLFSFSDYGAYISMIEKIKSGNKVFLQNGNFFFTISYLGYFYKYILGSLDFYFLFNCLCGSLTGLLMFNILRRAFYSPKAGIITIILYILYTEFMIFSSVFYTPTLMIFLLSGFVLLNYNLLILLN